MPAQSTVLALTDDASGNRSLSFASPFFSWRSPVKKILIAAIAAAVLSIGSEASASQISTDQVNAPQQVTVAPESDTIASRRRSRGVLRRLLELERRKNAWLRRTFLNG